MLCRREHDVERVLGDEPANTDGRLRPNAAQVDVGWRCGAQRLVGEQGGSPDERVAVGVDHLILLMITD